MMLLEVDPNLVRPGWTALLVIVILGIVLAFLGRSMLKQFGRIDVPADHPVDPATGSAPAPSDTDTSIEDVRTPTVPDSRAPTGDGGRAAPPEQR